MVSLFLLLGCNLSYIVYLFAALHELVSASAQTLLRIVSSVRVLLKPYGDTLSKTVSGSLKVSGWLRLRQYIKRDEQFCGDPFI